MTPLIWNAVASAAEGPEHMAFGTSNGPIFFGPPLLIVVSAASTMARVDGPPDPMMMPVRSLTTSEASRPASRIAWSMAIQFQPMPSFMKRFGFLGTIPSHSMDGAPCTWHLKPSSANFSEREMPERASRSDATTS